MSRQFVHSNSDRIDADYTPSGNSPWNAPFSVSCWVLMDNQPVSSDLFTIIDDGSGVNSWGIVFGYRISSGTKQWLYIDDITAGNATVRLWNENINTAQWYHLALINDGASSGANRIKLYRDGGLITATTISGDSNGGGSFFGNRTLGALADNTSTWDGRITQLIALNRLLNTSEITALSRGANFRKFGLPSNYFMLFPFEGLFNPEPDWSTNHFNSSGITGTSFATGPPTAARWS